MKYSKFQTYKEFEHVTKIKYITTFAHTTEKHGIFIT